MSLRLPVSHMMGNHLVLGLAGKLLADIMHELGMNDPQLVHMLDLSVVAACLRTRGWRVYHYRSRYGISDRSDYNSFMNYGREEGLIFGAYCPRLMEWKLANL